MERTFGALFYVEPGVESAVSKCLGARNMENCVTALAFATEETALYVNECFFHFFKKSAAKLKVIDSFAIFDLIRVYSECETHVTLFFKKGQIDIDGPLATKVVTFTVHYLHNILTGIETPEVDLFYFPYEDLKKHKLAPVMRMKALLLYQRQKIPVELLDRFSNMLHLMPVVNLFDLPEREQYMDVLLESLSCSTRVNEIFLANTRTKEIWSILGAFFARNNTITKLSIHGTVDSSITALWTKKPVRLKELHFKRPQFTGKTIGYLRELCDSLQITGLTIEKGLDPESVQLFSDLLHNKRKFTSLTSLTLRQLRPSNATLLLTGPLRLKRFAITGGTVELAHVIRALSAGCLEALEELILVNIPGEVIIEDCQITAPLKKVVIDAVIYSGDNLCHIFKIMSAYKVSLDLSHSVLDRERWNDCFEFMDNIPEPQITAFRWENNPLCQKLFNYLRRCANLTHLDLSGTITSSDHFLDQVVTMVETREIPQFTFCGTRKNILDCKLLRKICDLITYDTKLEHLHLRGNNIDDQTLTQLARSLVWNHTLKTLVMPNLQLSSTAPFTAFLETLLDRGTPIALTIPDFKKFLASHNVDPDTHARWKATLRRIRKGNPDTELQYPPERKIHTAKWESIGALLDQLANTGWPISQPEIPQLDNTKITEALAQKHSLKATINRLRRAHVPLSAQID